MNKQNEQKKQFWAETGFWKEAGILTVAVGIIAAAVFFFLMPSHASVSSISGLAIVLSNFVPLPVSAITMILNLRAGIRGKNRLYQHYAAAVSWNL